MPFSIFNYLFKIYVIDIEYTIQFEFWIIQTFFWIKIRNEIKQIILLVGY